MDIIKIYSTKNLPIFFEDLLSGKFDENTRSMSMLGNGTLKFVVLDEEIIFWDIKLNRRLIYSCSEGMEEYSNQNRKDYNQFGGGEIFIKKNEDLSYAIEFKGRSITFRHPKEHPFLKLFNELKMEASSKKIEASFDEEYKSFWKSDNENKVVVKKGFWSKFFSV